MDLEALACVRLGNRPCIKRRAQSLFVRFLFSFHYSNIANNCFPGNKGIYGQNIGLIISYDPVFCPIVSNSPESNSCARVWKWSYQHAVSVLGPLRLTGCL